MEVGGLFAVPTWHLFIRRNPGFILFIMPLWGPTGSKVTTLDAPSRSRADYFLIEFNFLPDRGTRHRPPATGFNPGPSNEGKIASSLSGAWFRPGALPSPSVG